MPDTNEIYRRDTDRRINELRDDFSALKLSTDNLHAEVRDTLKMVSATQIWVQENAQVTRDVRDILNGFSVAGKISGWIGKSAKWIVVVAAGWVVLSDNVHRWFTK